MSAIASYLQDPYKTELEVEVLEIGKDGERSFALLSDSLFYPEGGGQPPDHGSLGEARITDVQKSEQGARHYFSGQLAPGNAKIVVDWERRFDHMQQHSAQHLLTAVAADTFGWPTTSFHLGVSVCDIEIEAQPLSAKDLADLEDAVVAQIRAARPITSKLVAPEALQDLKVRSRGLPTGHRGDVRLVEIAGIDLAACGGTHVDSTAEIESLKLLSSEPLRGGQRLTFIAGRRVRARLQEHEQRTAALRKVLGAADDELLDIARGKLEQLKQLTRQRGRLLTELAELTVASLKSQEGALCERHFADVDLGFLGRVARSLCGKEDSRVVMLTAQDSRGAYLVLAAGGRSSLEVQAVGRQVAELLDGRGGGSGLVFQGKISSLEKRADALTLLHREMGIGSASVNES